MTGKHSRRSRGSSLVSAAVVGVLLVGGAYGALRLHDARQPSTEPVAAAASATPTVAAQTPTPAATPLRASRGNARSAEPSSAKTSAKATKAPETVTATGSCGASYYDEPQPTANGEEFDPEALTAAHKTWAFDTRVRVTNPDNGKSVVVRINDRGPYVDGRCIDLSRAAFRAIASLDLGHVDVTYEILK
ncbi:septal ring lytic transglycosylase RlpA family protein [Phytohabitans rumicis]|uniref:Probable endolytic peptidoglycan transglycosylase RlpA n=1 Tax=Phytohabitans rumicis TaxID=1076125 RepID=A0A6V8L762_9ACTN|nr:septal ring lytic transglycosylase RlpA family protein [Phytohabitans rumicis]GFJ90489.1 hypothetical protein Prum_041310 [Phytohabitans rumicis]